MTEPAPDFNRLKTALRGGTPDRVPLIEVLVDHQFKESFLGAAVRHVESDLRFWVSAGYDYIILGRRMVGYPPFWPAATLETYYEVQAAKPGTPHERGIVSTWRDLRDYPWMPPSQIDLRILDEIERCTTRGVKVIRYLGPVFQVVWMLMGFETFVFALRDDPGLVRAVFEKVAAPVREEFEDAIERDSVGAIWYVDDVAFKSGLMVRPDVLRRYQFPLIREMSTKCRERGIPFIYHTDGNIGEILPELIEMGVDALHPLEPAAVDIRTVKRLYGGRLCLCGNIELGTVLVTGAVEDVVTDVKAHIHDLASGGGYCLGSSNSVTHDVPIRNYRAMIDTAVAFGKYPIRV